MKIQTMYTVKHNTLMPYNMPYILVHQDHHQAPFLQKFKNISKLVLCKFFISESALIYEYLYVIN